MQNQISDTNGLQKKKKNKEKIKGTRNYYLKQ